MRAVGELEAEHVDEKRNLIIGARTVENDVTDLGRPRAIQTDIRMLRDIRRICSSAARPASRNENRSRRRRWQSSGAGSPAISTP